MLCVHNLSRFPQPVELDLQPFEGMRPIETFGGAEFPAIGQLPYLLTLSGHGFYWFRLAQRQEAPMSAVDTADLLAEYLARAAVVRRRRGRRRGHRHPRARLAAPSPTTGLGVRVELATVAPTARGPAVQPAAVVPARPAPRSSSTP